MFCALQISLLNRWNQIRVVSIKEKIIQMWQIQQIFAIGLFSGNIFREDTAGAPIYPNAKRRLGPTQTDSILSNQTETIALLKIAAMQMASLNGLAYSKVGKSRYGERINNA